MRRRRFLIPFSIFLVSLAALERADASNDHFVVLGPSVGFATGGDLETAALLSVDLSYAFMTSEPARSFIPNIKHLFWLSGGCRFLFQEEHIYLPYVEVGGWWILNLGVGYTAAVNGPEALGDHFFHAFVGAPLPVPLLFEKIPLLVEPYYRPAFGERVLHEAGLLIKYAAEI